MTDDIDEKQEVKPADTTGPSVSEPTQARPNPATSLGSQGFATQARVAAPAAPTTSVFRRFVWLQDRVAEARKTMFGPGKPGFAEYDAARRIKEGVVQIGETGQTSWAVLMLDRIAASLLVRSHAEKNGIVLTKGALTESDWENVRKVPVIQECWNNLSAIQSAALVESLGLSGEQATANLSDQQRKALATGLQSLVKCLSEPLEIEANRLGRALFARYTRVGLLLAVLLVFVSLVSNWVGARFEKPNVALHRAVEVSSQYPGAGEDHTLLVDGDRTNLGFHTNCEGPQWVVVDLGSVRRFDKVVVFNRDEFQERAVPLYLDVSSDKLTWRQLAMRKEVFDKWTASGLRADGRYVRLRHTPNNCFHLSEVEVY